MKEMASFLMKLVVIRPQKYQARNNYNSAHSAAQ
jgi:hypothetical protein